MSDIDPCPASPRDLATHVISATKVCWLLQPDLPTATLNGECPEASRCTRKHNPRLCDTPCSPDLADSASPVR